MDTIYVEEAVADHPRTHEILLRYPKARQVPIERYGDVFNAPSQNFRAQKANPALILANKQGNRVLETPPEYHIGGQHNYYFSHMLNCVYDCRYCFLQGMYRSANYVLFVNFEDFFSDINAQSNKHDDISWYFSGYDCDSLALEPLTGFVNLCLDHFANTPKAYLELRTKSTQIRQLLNRDPLSNCVVAMSLSPDAIVRNEEHRTASLAKRLSALSELQQMGWRIGLRFDPILAADNFTQLYEELIDTTFRVLDPANIHSVSLGPFRLPKPFYKRMIKLYPDSKLLSAELTSELPMVSYPKPTEQFMLNYVERRVLQFVDNDRYFPCVSIASE